MASPEQQSEDELMSREEAESLARRNMMSPASIVFAWCIRVAIMALLLWVLNRFMGPFSWIWWAWGAYAVLSLVSSLLLNRFKSNQLRKLAEIASRPE